MEHNHHLQAHRYQVTRAAGYRDELTAQRLRLPLASMVVVGVACPLSLAVMMAPSAFAKAFAKQRTNNC